MMIVPSPYGLGFIDRCLSSIATPAARRASLQPTCHGFLVIAKHHRAGERVEGIDTDNRAFH